MAEPMISDTKPAVMNLKARTYYWCSCGHSQGQPFYDGSHAGTEFSPLRFSIEEEKQVALCNCKSTKNPPFCDGTHSQL